LIVKQKGLEFGTLCNRKFDGSFVHSVASSNVDALQLGATIGQHKQDSSINFGGIGPQIVVGQIVEHVSRCLTGFTKRDRIFQREITQNERPNI